MSGEKKTTIKDVAKEANVSISVVSYVLNNKAGKTISDATKLRVTEAAKKLRYFPNRIASGMRNRKAMSIGVVSYWDMDGAAFMGMLSGAIEVASAYGYSVVVCNPKAGEDEYAYLDHYRSKSIDGIIFISPYEALGLIDEHTHINKMKSAGVPFVIINGHSCVADVSYINIDFYSSTYLATRYLISKGHSAITYVAPVSIPYSELHQRYLGYRDAVHEVDLPECICDIGDISTNIKSFKAVVTNKSDTAYAVMREAWAQGLNIPRDFVLIAGNTESYSEYLLPPLSTVKIDAKQMAASAAHYIVDCLNGNKAVITLKSQCCLQIRESC